jgi:hypothetical protein
MTEHLSSGYELTGVIVGVLRADATLTALLTGSVPRVSPDDHRVYQSFAELPATVAEVLPRVLVEVSETPVDVEQDESALPMATCTVWVHTMVEAYDRTLGESIHARLRVLCGSTYMAGARIIASMLVPTGVRKPVRESAFRDCWHFTHEYRAPLVGVAP